LVKAVLEQQEMIEDYKLKISDLEKRLKTIENLLATQSIKNNN
jgi:hypothetical protein